MKRTEVYWIIIPRSLFDMIIRISTSSKPIIMSLLRFIRNQTLRSSISSYSPLSFAFNDWVARKTTIIFKYIQACRINHALIAYFRTFRWRIIISNFFSHMVCCVTQNVNLTHVAVYRLKSLSGRALSLHHQSWKPRATRYGGKILMNQKEEEREKCN